MRPKVSVSAVFSLADEVKRVLDSVDPSLSYEQHEQLQQMLLYKLRITDLIGMSSSGDRNRARRIEEPNLPETGDILEDACQALLSRLDQVGPVRDASWGNFVIRALSLLEIQANTAWNELPDEGFTGILSQTMRLERPDLVGSWLIRLWDLLALPAEAKLKGLGRGLLQAGLEATVVASSPPREAPGASTDDTDPQEGIKPRQAPHSGLINHQDGPSSVPDLQNLRQHVLDRLRWRSPSTPLQGSPKGPASSAHARDDARGVGGSSVGGEAGKGEAAAGLRLACLTAGFLLGAGGGDLGAAPWNDGDNAGSLGGRLGVPRVVIEAGWRWDVHRRVLCLLRTCPSEEENRNVVLTLAGPLYSGWRCPVAFEEIWGLIANSGKDKLELHMSLLCILADGMLDTLSLPLRHTETLWDLIFAAVSCPSDLCRKRGLYVLQRTLSWVERKADDTQGRGEENPCGGGSLDEQESGRVLSDKKIDGVS
ncbi:unnamed protein product, partial [Discosporangium mesarthrocarpum]